MSTKKTSYMADGKNRFCHSIAELREMASKKYGINYDESNDESKSENNPETEIPDFSGVE